MTRGIAMEASRETVGRRHSYRLEMVLVLCEVEERTLAFSGYKRFLILRKTPHFINDIGDGEIPMRLG